MSRVYVCTFERVRIEVDDQDGQFYALPVGRGEPMSSASLTSLKSRLRRSNGIDGDIRLMEGVKLDPRYRRHNRFVELHVKCLTDKAVIDAKEVTRDLKAYELYPYNLGVAESARRLMNKWDQETRDLESKQRQEADVFNAELGKPLTRIQIKAMLVASQPSNFKKESK